MNDKGYHGVVRLDDESGVLLGKVANLKDVITFQGRTVEEVRQAFRDSWANPWSSAPDGASRPSGPATAGSSSASSLRSTAYCLRRRWIGGSASTSSSPDAWPSCDRSRRRPRGGRERGSWVDPAKGPEGRVDGKLSRPAPLPSQAAGSSTPGNSALACSRAWANASTRPAGSIPFFRSTSTR
jgi:hypothetical protein